MNYRGFTRLEAVLVVAVTGISALALLPALAETATEARERVKVESESCQSNLKNIARGLSLYMQDADELLPPVSSSNKKGQPFGWADLLQPYIKEVSVFQCPSERTPASQEPNKNAYSDYWFNKNLSGLKGAKLEAPTVTLMNGGGETANGRSAMNSMPEKWLDGQGTPGRRHYGGANYAFADGHVKWLQPGETTEHSISSGGTNTFAVR